MALQETGRGGSRTATPSSRQLVTAALFAVAAGSSEAGRSPGLWGAEIRSCSSSILVEEPAKQVTSLYPGLATLADEVQANGWTWRLQPERPMRSMRVVVLDVDPEHLFQVASPDDQQPVQALSPHRRDPPLRERVRVGRLERGAQHRGALRPEHIVEAATELRVTVAEQKPYPSALFSSTIMRLRACWVT